MGKRRVGGFTLIELMLVVAIIALLAAIAIPKFADLIIRAKEAGVKGKTGAFRSALTIYYADNEGFLPLFPGFVETSLVPKYISQIPTISIPTGPTHTNGNGIAPIYTDWKDDFGVEGLAWTYSNNPNVRVNCNHPDSRGSTWSLF